MTKVVPAVRSKGVAISVAELNHIRRLVAWVDCEIGQAPEDLVLTVKRIGGVMDPGELTDAAKARLVAAHQRASLVPRYVRDAVASVHKVTRRTFG
jgi:hypothetical protein